MLVVACGSNPLCVALGPPRICGLCVFLPQSSEIAEVYAEHVR